MVGLEDLQTLVLDEADRLLEMGFSEEVLPHDCHILRMRALYSVIAIVTSKMGRECPTR